MGVVAFKQNDQARIRAAERSLKDKAYLDALDMLRPLGPDGWGRVSEVYTCMNCAEAARRYAAMHFISHVSDEESWIRLADADRAVGFLYEALMLLERYCERYPDGGKFAYADGARMELKEQIMLWKQSQQLTEENRRHRTRINLGTLRADAQDTYSMFVITDAVIEITQSDDHSREEELRTILRSLPLDNRYLRFLAARGYIWLGEHPQAITVLLGIEPASLELVGFRRQLRMLMALNCFEPLLRYVEAGLRQYPYDGELLYLSAIVYLSLERQEDASACLKRAYRVDHRDSVSKYWQKCLEEGTVDAGDFSVAFRLPRQEFLWRSIRVKQLHCMDTKSIKETPLSETDQEVLHWAMLSGIPELVHRAARLLTIVNVEEASQLMLMSSVSVDQPTELSQNMLEAVSVARPDWAEGIAQYREVCGGFDELETLIRKGTLPVRTVLRNADAYLTQERGVFAAPRLASAWKRGARVLTRHLNETAVCTAALCALVLGEDADRAELSHDFDVKPRRLDHLISRLQAEE